MADFLSSTRLTLACAFVQRDLIEAESRFAQALAMREKSSEAPQSSVAESLVDMVQVLLASVRIMNVLGWRENQNTNRRD